MGSKPPGGVGPSEAEEVCADGGTMGGGGAGGGGAGGGEAGWSGFFFPGSKPMGHLVHCGAEQALDSGAGSGPHSQEA
ncbi:hypothetical protein HZA57_10215 [Candidatus Poribacteria bacterium]|nr:hypothetical protein [Candidatus Poribacteria bacterium]